VVRPIRFLPLNDKKKKTRYKEKEEQQTGAIHAKSGSASLPMNSNKKKTSGSASLPMKDKRRKPDTKKRIQKGLYRLVLSTKLCHNIFGRNDTILISSHLLLLLVFWFGAIAVIV
jgi:hypothetical protein